MLPKNIRGIMNGIFYFFANFGLLIFSKPAGYLYDSYGPKIPFLVVLILDVSFAIVVLAMKGLGKIK